MLFYLDENVPAPVQLVLEDAGHSVIWTRDITGQGAADDIVAAISERDQATLISHDRDFKKIAPRIPDGHRTRFRKLSMIRMMCIKPRSAARISAILPYIEFDFNQRLGLPDRRSIIEVKTDLISIFR
jgi:predicted nuclease of predicted toxin-antitoxin system